MEVTAEGVEVSGDDQAPGGRRRLMEEDSGNGTASGSVIGGSAGGGAVDEDTPAASPESPPPPESPTNGTTGDDGSGLVRSSEEEVLSGNKIPMDQREEKAFGQPCNVGEHRCAGSKSVQCFNVGGGQYTTENTFRCTKSCGADSQCSGHVGYKCSAYWYNFFTAGFCVQG